MIAFRPLAALGAVAVSAVLATAGDAAPLQAALARGGAQHGDHAIASASRLVAIGDIHGAYDEFVSVLRVAGLLDDAGHWSGGQATLVQTGDFTDRGARVRDVMDLLRRLEREAAEAGGRVVVLMGNHEAMNLFGHVRDATPEIFESFATEDSDDVQSDGFDEYQRAFLERDAGWRGASRSQRRGVRERWLRDQLPGRIEYVRAMSPEGEYGAWLGTLPFAVVIDEILFLHAGIPAELSDRALDDLVSRVFAEVATFAAYREYLLERERITSFSDLTEVVAGAAVETGGLGWLTDFVPDVREPAPLPALPLESAPDARKRFEALFRIDEWYVLMDGGPLWYRGLAQLDESRGKAALEPVLRNLGVRAVVAGHTPQIRGVRARFDAQAYLIDTGMLASAYHGIPSALEIVGTTVRALYGDGRVVEMPALQPATTTDEQP